MQRIKTLRALIIFLLIVLIFNGCSIKNSDNSKSIKPYDGVIDNIIEKIQANKYKISTMPYEIDYVENELKCKLVNVDEEHGFDLAEYSYDENLSFSLTCIPINIITFYVDNKEYKTIDLDQWTGDVPLTLD